VAALLSEGHSPEKLLGVTGDVSEPEDAQHIVDRTLIAWGKIDILVNNAGVYGPKGPIDDVDWDLWVKAVGINLAGSVLMCRTVLPHFRRQKYGKIIQISGGGATKPMPMVSAYAASKAAVVRFAETLAQEVRAFNIDVNCIAPGALNTKMLGEILQAGPERVGQQFYDAAVAQNNAGGDSPVRAAALAVFLGSSETDGITGKLISAIWDPWERFNEHRADLLTTDIYTLRRVVPKDRALKWGHDAL
jgi:NAD(P)-dependent dehydrogenase (short-subunit alcohol dehydrogenase family)